MAATRTPVNFSLVQPAPGHGLPLEHIIAAHHKDPLYICPAMPSALVKDDMYECALRLTPVREFSMMGFMNAVTDKREWYKKVLDNNIVAKWKSEVPQSEFTDKMFKYCIQELRYIASKFDPSASGGAVIVFEGKVVKSDSAVPESTRLALQHAIKPLENVPEVYKDWHPGSNQQVLDLVHPSLFPLVFGKTRVLAVGSKATTLDDCVVRCGEGDIIPVPVVQLSQPMPYAWQRSDPYNPYSTKFQWLPCEVDISGGRSRIVSYINNLHPQKHSELYGALEDIIDASIPLWEATLGGLNAGTAFFFGRIQYLKTIFDPEYDNIPPHQGPQKTDGETDRDYVRLWLFGSSATTLVDYYVQTDSHPVSSCTRYLALNHCVATPPICVSVCVCVWVPPPSLCCAISTDYENRRTDWWRDMRLTVQPEPTLPFDETAFERANQKTDLREIYGKEGRPLQVIVKLANIELTPDNPNYPGGVWHVEGKLNEHICATAIYYHSCSNISDSSLAFRQLIGDDYTCINYGQDDHDWLTPIFGVAQEGPRLQTIGSVKSLEGRLVTFPNIVQHRVQPFKLEDPSKPGHRKIVALFLVDPNVRVISTASIPCQRLDWWKEAAVSESEIMNTPTGLLGRLPVEIQDQVFDKVEGFPVSLKEAEELRLGLMEERKIFALDHQKAIEGRIFSLCEH